MVRQGLVLCAAVLFGGVTQAQEAARVMAPQAPTAANNAFACDLYQKLAEEAKGKNVFFSPFSAATALAMAFEGARGDTALEMGQVLRLNQELRSNTPEQPWRTAPYLASVQAFATKVVSPAKAPYELKIANGLFGEKTYPFRPEYVNSVDRIFGTGAMRAVDFKHDYPSERAKINRWVEAQTNSRIKDLLPQLSPEEASLLRLVLINAVYFKGEWVHSFNEKLTKQGDFLLAGGGRTAASLMEMPSAKDAGYAAFRGDGSFFPTPLYNISFSEKQEHYPNADGFQIAELPFKGNALSFVMIAPRDPGKLGAIEAKVTGEALAAWLGKLEKRTVHVTMPRFKMETDYSLKAALQALGMRKAFVEGVGNFSWMTTSPDFKDKLYISRVLQKAFVQVNEKGAEAAAATAVMMAAPTAAPVSQPFTPTFRADRPHLFLIRDRASGMILFLGRMTAPPA